MSIASLNAEKTALQAEHDSIRAAIVDAEKALAQPGLLEIDKLILANRAQSLHNRSISLGQRIMTLDARLAKLQWSNIDIMSAAVIGAGMTGSTWCFIYPRYCAWRHEWRPYSVHQIRRRQHIFGRMFQQPLFATRQAVKFVVAVTFIECACNVFANGRVW